jgi:hypothetical protein
MADFLFLQAGMLFANFFFINNIQALQSIELEGRELRLCIRRLHSEQTHILLSSGKKGN